MMGTSLVVSLVVWGSAAMPLVVRVSTARSSVVMVSLATAFAVSIEVPLSSEGGEAVVKLPAPLVIAAVAPLVRVESRSST